MRLSSPEARRPSASRRRAAGSRTGEQREGHRLARKEAVERQRVLLGEGLGRCHQGALVARLERAQHRVEGDDGLAAADLAHQQALHRAPALQVGVDLAERTPLVGGRLEGKRGDPAVDKLAGRVEARAVGAPAALAPPRGERGLVEEELLEDQPAAGVGGLLGGLREVGRPQRVGLAGKAPPGAKLGGQRLDRVLGLREGLPGPLAQPLRADRLARGMNRDESGRMQAGRALRPRRRRSRACRPGSRGGRACRASADGCPASACRRARPG